MSHAHAYSISNAISRVFLRPPVSRGRTQSPTVRAIHAHPRRPEKLSRKQREALGVRSPEDEARIREAAQRRARKDALQAGKGQHAPLGSSRAQALLVQIQREAQAKGKGTKGSVVAVGKQQSEKRPQNEQIKEAYVNLVSHQGVLRENVPKAEIIGRLDRSQDVLVMLQPGSAKTPNGLPICKIFSLVEIADVERQKRRVKSEQQQAVKGGKELELRWTIGPADLELKLKTLKRFLVEGRKVDVTLSRKFKRRVPDMTMTQLKGVVDQVTAAALSVPGAKQTQKAEGNLGEQIVLQFEGPRGGVKQEDEDEDADEDEDEDADKDAEEDAHSFAEPDVADRAAS